MESKGWEHSSIDKIIGEGDLPWNEVSLVENTP